MKGLWRSWNRNMDRELRDVRALVSQWMIRSVEKVANNTILINWILLLIVVAGWTLVGMGVWNLWLK